MWSKIIMVSVFILLSKTFDICEISGAGIELMFAESPAGRGGNSISEVFHRITEGLTLIDHSDLCTRVNMEELEQIYMTNAHTH